MKLDLYQVGGVAQGELRGKGHTCRPRASGARWVNPEFLNAIIGKVMSRPRNADIMKVCIASGPLVLRSNWAQLEGVRYGKCDPVSQAEPA